MRLSVFQYCVVPASDTPPPTVSLGPLHGPRAASRNSNVKPVSTLFLAIFLASVCGTPMAASFDCARARTHVEHLICASPGLSRLDDEMGALYAKIESETAGVDGDTGAVLDPLNDEQSRWLGHVRDRCMTVGCLKRVYLHRIRQMKAKWKDALS